MSLGQLLGTLRDRYRDPNAFTSSLPPDVIDPEWAPRLGRILALQHIQPTDLIDAVLLFRAVDELHGLASIHPESAKAHADLLFTLGYEDELRELLPRMNLAVGEIVKYQADLQNPYRHNDRPSERHIQPWLSRVSEIMQLSNHGLEELSLDREGPTPFDRLRVGTTEEHRDGPLVTVIVTAYRPQPALLTAVGSIVDQTYANLEILLVDDGSPTEFDELLTEAASLDPRIRLIKLPSNGGTYRARNAGISLARGKMTTFQDSDDWSHPRRIELQAAPLIEDPNLVATRAYCVRANENLILTRVGYNPRQLNTSSLLFRTTEVLSSIGFMDEVRKGADTEFVERIRITFRKGLKDIANPALSVVRLDDDSLSRGDFRPGWHHQSRFAYRSAYTEWHRQISAGKPPFLDPAEDFQPFARPLQSRQDPVDRHYDVVFLGDWRQFGGPQKSMLAEIQAARSASLRVGVAQMEAFRFMTPRRRLLCQPIQQLINAGAVDFVLLDDDIDIDLLLVRYPPILQFPPVERSRWRVGHVWIVANQAPYEHDGTDIRYDVADCTNNAKRLFGQEPLWVPQGPPVRAAIARLIPPGQLTSFDNLGIIDSDKWFSPRTPWEHDHVRAGRYSRDYPLKFPATREGLLKAYPDSPDFRIRMMGAVQSVGELLADMETPDTWELLPYAAVSPEEFLSSIDFFVYYDHPAIVEAFGRSVLEAIASGAIAVLPEHYRATFSEAAVYAAEEDVEELLRYFHSMPHAYKAQVDRSRQVLIDQFSDQSFIQRIASFVPALDRLKNSPRSTGKGTSQTYRHRSNPQVGGEEGPSEVASFRHGFLITDASSGAYPSGWPTEIISGLRYARHPATRMTVVEVPSDRPLRAPITVAVFGDPIDLTDPSNDPEEIVERIASSATEGGVQALTEKVSYLAGRFTCIVHVEGSLRVLPDLQASQSAHCAMTAGEFVLASHKSLIALVLHAEDTEGPHIPPDSLAVGSVVLDPDRITRLAPNCRMDIDLHRNAVRLERFYPERSVGSKFAEEAAIDPVALLRAYWQLLPKDSPIGLCLDSYSEPWIEGLRTLFGHRLFTYSIVEEGEGTGELQRLNALAASFGLPHRILFEQPGGDPASFQAAYEASWSSPSIWTQRSRALYEQLPSSILLEQLGPAAPCQSRDVRLPEVDGETVARYRRRTGLNGTHDLKEPIADALARWEIDNLLYWSRRAQEADLKHRMFPLLGSRFFFDYASSHASDFDGE
jgi:O-antigen biosynthesis protein